MCGVFGYIAKDKGARPDMRRLARIARVTEQRGRDAFGFAWLDGKGRMRSFRQEGRISDYLGLLDMAADARMLIGHCRLATNGDPASNINNHPHAVDGGWLVHNGVIGNHLEIRQRHDLWASSECDSEVLGLLIEHLPGSVASRCAKAVQACRPGPLVMLGLWKPGRLVAVRRGNPLHVGDDVSGTYLASLSAELPGDVMAVDDASVMEWSFNNKGCSYGKASILAGRSERSDYLSHRRGTARSTEGPRQGAWGF